MSHFLVSFPLQTWDNRCSQPIPWPRRAWFDGHEIMPSLLFVSQNCYFQLSSLAHSPPHIRQPVNFTPCPVLLLSCMCFGLCAMLWLSLEVVSFSPMSWSLINLLMTSKFHSTGAELPPEIYMYLLSPPRTRTGQVLSMTELLVSFSTLLLSCISSYPVLFFSVGASASPETLTPQQSMPLSANCLLNVYRHSSVLFNPLQCKVHISNTVVSNFTCFHSVPPLKTFHIKMQIDLKSTKGLGLSCMPLSSPFSSQWEESHH